MIHLVKYALFTSQVLKILSLISKELPQVLKEKYEHMKKLEHPESAARQRIWRTVKCLKEMAMSAQVSLRDGECILGLKNMSSARASGSSRTMD